MAFRLQEPTIVGRFFDYPAGAASSPNKSACWYAASVQASDFVARIGVRAKGALCAMFEGLMERVAVPCIDSATPYPITGMKTRGVAGAGSVTGCLEGAADRGMISGYDPRGWFQAVNDFYDSVFRSFFWSGTRSVATVTGNITVGGWTTGHVSLAHHKSPPAEYQSWYNSQATTCASLEWYMDGKVSPWHGDSRPGDQASMFDQWTEGALSACGAVNVVGSWNDRSFEQYATDLVVNAAHAGGNNYWTTDAESLANGLTWVSPRRATVAYAVAQSMLAAMRCTMFRFGYLPRYVLRKQTREDVWAVTYDAEGKRFTADKASEGDVVEDEVVGYGVNAYRSLTSVGYVSTPVLVLKLPEDVYARPTSSEETVDVGMEMLDHVFRVDGDAGTLQIKAECCGPVRAASGIAAPTYPRPELVEDGYLHSHCCSFPEKFVDGLHNYGLDGKARREPAGNIVWVDAVTVETNRLADAVATHEQNAITEAGLGFVSLPQLPEVVDAKVAALSQSILGTIQTRYFPGFNETDPGSGVCMPFYVMVQGNSYLVQQNDEGEWVCEMQVYFDMSQDESFCMNGAPSFFEEFRNDGSMDTGEHACLGTTKWNFKAVPVQS